jgi:diamine N-acetyltransferase
LLCSLTLLQNNQGLNQTRLRLFLFGDQRQNVDGAPVASHTSAFGTTVDRVCILLKQVNAKRIFAAMEVTLRYATKDDAALVADISQQTFYDTFAADNTEADMQKFLKEQFTKGRLMLEVGAPENMFLLAYCGEEVAGYLKLREGKKLAALNGMATMEIARLYVMKNYIGHGIGKLLMQAALDIAKEKEKDVVWLGVWEKNQRAIAFYTAWGFQKFSECDFLLGDDLQRDWLMKKHLAET